CDVEAGTDARVYLDLLGARQQRHDLLLRDTGHCFERGGEDVFLFPDSGGPGGGLGPLASVCISHDDSGASPNWQLEWVEVQYTRPGRTLLFPCGAGLGKDKSLDGALERVLYPLPRPLAHETRGEDPLHAATALPVVQPLSVVEGAAGMRVYHLLLRLADVGLRGALELGWQAVEAVQLAGVTQVSRAETAGVQHTDVIALDTGRCSFDIQADDQLLRWLQRQSSEARLQGGGSPHPLEPPHTTYQVTLFTSRLHPPVPPPGPPRRLSLLLHGAQASSTALPLGPASALSASLALALRRQGPFSEAGQPEVFVVRWSGASLGQLLRADLKLE
ncbi:hypothetical protein QJQ45_019919, partial [Haematococcus lacustris]